MRHTEGRLLLSLLLVASCSEAGESREPAWPEPDLEGPGCEYQCVDAGYGELVEYRPLSCGCQGAPCDIDLDTYLSRTACRLDAEVVMFACADRDAQYIRLAAPGKTLVVLAFDRGALVGYQYGEAEDNACGGGHRRFGETELDCVTKPDECDPCDANELQTCRQPIDAAAVDWDAGGYV